MKINKWDFSVYYDEDRVEEVRSRYNEKYSNELLLKHNDTILNERSALSKELESAANYILYGKKKETNKNLIQEKQVQVESKYKSYSRKAVQSLDLLLEDPIRASSIENNIQPLKRSIYTNPKPKIDRTTDGWIPGMKDLWEQIDLISAKIKSYNKDEKNEKDQTKSFNSYRLKHLLIELRQSQHTLKESYVPTIRMAKKMQLKHSFIKWGEDTGYLVNVEGMDDACAASLIQGILERNKNLKAEDNYIVVSENSIDYGDKHHIYCLLENYSLLKESVWEELSADIRYELYYLEYLIDRTELSEVRQFILEKKIDKSSNFQISEDIYMKFGIFYNPNYISTIWKQEICGKIANMARLLQREESCLGQEDKWRTCIGCKQKLLLDKVNFLFDKIENDYKRICRKCGREQKKIKLEKAESRK